MRFSLLFLLAVLVQAAPQRDRRAIEADAASISGRITERDSGQPIARAVVTLLSAERSRRVETTADADGRYEFAALPAGDYLLWAGPPDMRSTHLLQVFGESEPSNLLFPRANLKLKAGDALTGHDIALFRALGIEGRVVDPWDEPMADVEVRLTRTSGAPVPAEPARTDDRGRFRLFGLAPGRYRVCAEPHYRVTDDPDMERSRLVRTCHPGAVNPAGAGEVVLTIGDAIGIDIRVQLGGTYTISGVVTQVSGDPVKDAFVAAYSVNSPGDAGVSSNIRTANGQFVLRGLTPGRYLVTASSGHSGFPDRDAPERIDMGFSEVDLAGDLAGITVPLSKAQTVAGRVVFEGGAPPEARRQRMVVQANPPRGSSLAIRWRPPSPVDDNLQFELTGIYRLPLVVGIQQLPEGWVAKAVRHADRDITGIATDLGDPSVPKQLVITLTNRVARASVRATNEQGEAVASYRVVVLHADSARWNAGYWWNEKTPSTDGIVELAPLVPGEYLVAALEQADLMLVSGPEGIARIAKAATKVRLEEGDNGILEVRLARVGPPDR